MKKLLLLTLAWTSLSLCTIPETIASVHEAIEHSDLELFKERFSELNPTELSVEEITEMVQLAQLTTKLRKDDVLFHYTERQLNYGSVLSYILLTSGLLGVAQQARQYLLSKANVSPKILTFEAALLTTGILMRKFCQTAKHRDLKDKLKQARHIEALLLLEQDS